jgi:predicted RNase H-like HicB family nuclease
MDKHKVTVILLPDIETGTYTVHIPLFPGCVTGGRTVSEALRNAKKALELHLEEASSDDLQDLELSHFDHVVVGEIEVKVAAKSLMKT